MLSASLNKTFPSVRPSSLPSKSHMLSKLPRASSVDINKYMATADSLAAGTALPEVPETMIL